MNDYQKELDLYRDSLSDLEKTELQKLANMQKDIAVGDSAEDFIRHPFFRAFEQHMNEMIAGANTKLAEIIAKPGTTMEDLKAHSAGIEKIKELKRWLNKHVIAGRVAKQSISLYEEETDKMNQKVQEAVEKVKSQQSPQ